jgi:cysteine desulfurase / selenocysteine lyase
MNKIKLDFPIFKNNPWIVFLDNAASTQKPYYVINWTSHFLENDYANIHRWMYTLSEKSEILYEKSKDKVAQLINAKSKFEINYSYNATYALNLIAQNLKKSNFLKKWDKVLLSISEHHSNIVPWLILKDEIWIKLDYINLDNDFCLDLNDLEKKLTSDVKVISLCYVSNVSWSIFDLKKVWEIINKKNNRNSVRFIVDASQAVPNFKVNVQDLDCDFLVFSWHKIIAQTWIWVLYWKQNLLKELTSAFWWWWAIDTVEKNNFIASGLPFRFEPGTPNIVWAISLLCALEYLESIWWYEAIRKNELKLIQYTLDWFKKLWKNIILIWNQKLEKRVWVFSFYIPQVHSVDFEDYMAEKNICIRAWYHCAEPFIKSLWINALIRLSLYIYNDKSDIDKFFKLWSQFINEIKN